MNSSVLKRKSKILLEQYEFADRVLPKDILVGDIGCRTGYGTKVLKNGRKVIGLDKPEVVKQARIDYPGEYLEVDFDDKNVVSYEFDAIVCLDTLLHLKEPEDFLSKLKTKYLIISAAIDTDVSEDQFKRMLIGKWIIKDELWQHCDKKENYLVVYATNGSNNT